MKVLYVLREPVIGGVESVVINLCKDLAGYDVQTEILFLKKGEQDVNFPDSIKTHQNTGSLLSNLNSNIRLFKQFNIVHNHSFGLISFYVWLISLVARVRLVTTLHSSFNVSISFLTWFPFGGQRIFLFYNFFEWVFGFLGEKVIVVTPHIIDSLCNILEIEDSKVVTIVNAVKSSKISTRLTSRNKQIVFAGRLAEEKRVGLIISGWAKAITLIDDEEWKLVIIGDGPLKDDLMRQAQDLRITGRINFIGSVPDITPFIRNSQIGISASAFEGLPLTILEYMNAGMCCIASDIDAHRFLEINKWGIIADPNLQKDFAAAIASLTDNPELRLSLSYNALKIADQFSNEKFVTAHYDLYTRVES